MSKSQTFSSILLERNIPRHPGESDPSVGLFPDINDDNAQRGLSWVALVHGLNYQSPLALGQSLQVLCSLDVSCQRVDGEAPYRVGKAIKHRAVSPEVLVLRPHGGQHSAARHAAGGDIQDEWVLNEEGSIVVDILDVDRHLSGGVVWIYRGRICGAHLKGVRCRFLPVQGGCCDDATCVLVYDEHALGAAAQRVQHMAIGALVQIYGFHLKHKRANGNIFGDVCSVAAALKHRAVIVHVHDSHLNRGGAAVGRAALIQCCDGQCVSSSLLPVQRP